MSTSIGDLVSIASLMPKLALALVDSPCPLLRPTGGPYVGVSPDGRRPLAAHQNCLDGVFLTLEYLVYMRSSAVWDTEDILDSGFL